MTKGVAEIPDPAGKLTGALAANGHSSGRARSTPIPKAMTLAGFQATAAWRQRFKRSPGWPKRWESGAVSVGLEPGDKGTDWSSIGNRRRGRCQYGSPVRAP